MYVLGKRIKYYISCKFTIIFVPDLSISNNRAINVPTMDVNVHSVTRMCRRIATHSGGSNDHHSVGLCMI